MTYDNSWNNKAHVTYDISWLGRKRVTCDICHMTEEEKIWHKTYLLLWGFGPMT